VYLRAAKFRDELHRRDENEDAYDVRYNEPEEPLLEELRGGSGIEGKFRGCTRQKEKEGHNPKKYEAVEN
jgi:hypothetical protein